MYIIDTFLSIIRYLETMSTKKAYKLASVPLVIRHFRNAANLSQEKMGERLGVSGNYISRLELGQEYPSIGMLIRIAQALDVRPGEMLDAIAKQEGANK